MSFGQTIFDYEPDCAGAKDYRQLAQSVVAADPSKLTTVEIEVKNEQQGTPEAGPIHNDKN